MDSEAIIHNRTTLAVIQFCHRIIDGRYLGQPHHHEKLLITGNLSLIWTYTIYSQIRKIRFFIHLKILN